MAAVLGVEDGAGALSEGLADAVVPSEGISAKRSAAGKEAGSQKRRKVAAPATPLRQRDPSALTRCVLDVACAAAREAGAAMKASAGKIAVRVLCWSARAFPHHTSR